MENLRIESHYQFFFVWFQLLCRYLLLSGGAYLFVWKFLYKKNSSLFMYDELPPKKELYREIFYSCIATLILAFITVLNIKLTKLGWTNIYWRISDYSMGWYLVSYVLVFLAQETYYYWTHRFFHIKKLYSMFHWVHHQSSKPSPFAVMSFHPLEFVVNGMFFVLISLIIPIHISVFAFFTLFILVINIYEHLSFSFFPKKLDSFPFVCILHPIHHGWHHQHQNGNYGHYMRLWDQLMGTWKGDFKKK